MTREFPLLCTRAGMTREFPLLCTRAGMTREFPLLCTRAGMTREFPLICTSLMPRPVPRAAAVGGERLGTRLDMY